MKIFFAVVSVSVRSAFSFFDAPLATNTDLSTTFALHLLQTVATRTDEETKEVNFGKLFHRNVDFVLGSVRSLLLMILSGGAEGRIGFQSTVDELNALFFETLAVADFASVGTTTVRIILRRWGWGSAKVGN